MTLPLLLVGGSALGDVAASSESSRWCWGSARPSAVAAVQPQCEMPPAWVAVVHIRQNQSSCCPETSPAHDGAFPSPASCAGSPQCHLLNVTSRGTLDISPHSTARDTKLEQGLVQETDDPVLPRACPPCSLGCTSLIPSSSSPEGWVPHQSPWALLTDLPQHPHCGSSLSGSTTLDPGPWAVPQRTLPATSLQNRGTRQLSS